MTVSKAVYWLSRVVLGGVFIFAAVGKIINPAAFADNIDNYQLLPYLLISITAIILPWIELVCGSLIITGFWIRGASFIVSILNVLFLAAIASAMIRGLNIDCGCFSVGAERVGWVRLAEDVVFLALSVYLFVTSMRQPE